MNTLDWEASVAHAVERPEDEETAWTWGDTPTGVWPIATANEPPAEDIK
jgi:hypothetical protein